MTPMRQPMMTALELSGKSQRTQQSYVREVRLLATFYNKSPHLISEAELRRYLLHRKNKDRLAPSSMRICYSGIRFFYRYVYYHRPASKPISPLRTSTRGTGQKSAT